MRSIRLLVTGASGLLGLNLALDAAREHTVFGTVYSHPVKADAFNVLKTDLLAPGAVERLLDQTQPDWVIHCAALANLEACEDRPDLARQLNTELPALLARYVARGGARLIHVSTDAVFDGRRGDYSEEDTPNPLGVYAQTKLAGERAVAEVNSDAIIARVNIFGWSLSGKRSLAEFFLRNLQARQQIMGFTDVYFCPLLVNHISRIFLKMLEQNLSGLYHVVSRQCTSKYAFGVELAHAFGLDPGFIKPTLVTNSGLRAARSPRLTLRSEKLAQALGEALPDLSTGLKAFYQLYQQGYPQKLRELGDNGANFGSQTVK